MHRLLAVALFVSVCSPALSQDTPKRPDTAVLNFFIGKWTGEGAFANGNKIAADLTFTLSLDSCWLVYEHRDRAPGKYKATSMWGVDAQSGEFLSYCFDNFQGHRIFEITGQCEGYGRGGTKDDVPTKFWWRNGKLILFHHAFLGGVGLYFEHFIYQRTGEHTFKMTYETSRDGVSWQMGDWLEFSKVQG